MFFVFLCATPYMGLRTYSGSFAMFSNLRVEGCKPNHWLLRDVLKLRPMSIGFLSDAVEVVDTNVPELRAFQ